MVKYIEAHNQYKDYELFKCNNLRSSFDYYIEVKGELMFKKFTRVVIFVIVLAVLLGIALFFTQKRNSSGDLKQAAIPDYSGSASVVLNGNVPSFTKDEITTISFESYGELDYLGRCTTALACLGPDLMPTKERESIAEIKPTGWNQNKYPGIVDSEPPYLYNRCHLIGYQLTGENANERNLITGTRYMNIEGMLPYENKVAAYIKETGNHVMYRVTPVFEGINLLCS